MAWIRQIVKMLTLRMFPQLLLSFSSLYHMFLILQLLIASYCAQYLILPFCLLLHFLCQGYSCIPVLTYQSWTYLSMSSLTFASFTRPFSCPIVRTLCSVSLLSTCPSIADHLKHVLCDQHVVSVLISIIHLFSAQVDKSSHTVMYLTLNTVPQC